MAGHQVCHYLHFIIFAVYCLESGITLQPAKIAIMSNHAENKSKNNVQPDNKTASKFSETDSKGILYWIRKMGN